MESLCPFYPLTSALYPVLGHLQFLVLKESVRLFHQAFINVGDLHLALPASHFDKSATCKMDDVLFHHAVDPDFSVKPSTLRTNVVFELIGTWLGLGLGGLGTKVLGPGGLTLKINIEISIYSAFISKRTEEWGCYKLILLLLRFPKASLGSQD